MEKDHLSRKLAALLHADVVGSTSLVQKNETLAHERIQDTFRRFSETISSYGGVALEIRGDALVAEFAKVSDAVCASLAFQATNTVLNEKIFDDILPVLRIGIAIGEVVVADNTVTGEGIVLAQRIEQLAEPGGICIQGTASETIPRRLNFEYVSLGKQQLKGFENSVRVYTVKSRPGENIPEPEASAKPASSRQPWAIAAVILLLATTGLIAWLQPWQSEVERADPDKMSYALPDKPSIAVLPFDNISSDKEQEYFSDGITEDIITDISKISGLFVVARNSTFTYKGKAVKIRQVAEDLGVRYVLEGSVRRAGKQIRITAQLIDALTGNHVWADRYDRDLEDIFSVQSEVATQVAKALAVTLKANENERLFQEYTTNIDAYDVFLQARRTVDKPSKGNILRGEQLFKRVIELDPNFAGGYAGLSFNYSVQIRFQYSSTPSSHLTRAFELANKAIEIDHGYAWGHIALGGAYLAKGEASAAVEAVRQALILEPNGYEPNLFMGFYLQFAGESERAVEHLLVAKRLSPVESVRDRAFMSMAQFMNRNYDETVRLGRRNSKNGRVMLAAAYTLLDRPDKAAEIVTKLLETHPNFNLSQWSYGKLWEAEENRARLYNAAKQAGIPEFPRGQ